MPRRAEPTEEQKEIKRHVRQLEREVHQLIYKNSVACRRYAWWCENDCSVQDEEKWPWRRGRRIMGEYLIERPIERYCAVCGCQLRWRVAQ
jgi:hypothetical protein